MFNELIDRLHFWSPNSRTWQNSLPMSNKRLSLPLAGLVTAADLIGVGGEDLFHQKKFEFFHLRLNTTQGQLMMVIGRKWSHVFLSI